MNDAEAHFPSESEMAEMESRLSQLSPAPWRSWVEGRDHTSGSSCITIGPAGTDYPDIEPLGATAADQDFMAACRQDVPRLLAEVRRLRQLLAAERP